MGEYREGLVSTETKEGLLVDIGVQQPALLRQKQFGLGERLTLQVIKVGEPVEVHPVSRDGIPLYWGYSVRVEKRLLGQFLAAGYFDLKVATARIGDNFIDITSRLCEKWNSSRQVLVVFGAPSRGLHEILADEGLE